MIIDDIMLSSLEKMYNDPTASTSLAEDGKVSLCNMHTFFTRSNIYTAKKDFQKVVKTMTGNILP